MNEAFDIVKRARNQVGESSDGRLTNEQYDKALEWMQHQVFEGTFMTSQSIKRRISQAEDLKGAAKKKLHSDRRGAFKTWKWQLLGSPALLHMVLCHGIFDAGEQRRFLLAYEQNLEDHLRQTTPTIDPKSQIYKDIRSNAHKARDEEKRANKLCLHVVKEQEVKLRKMTERGRPQIDLIATNFEELVALSPDKQWMLTALDSGALESTREKADEWFGHGRNIIPKRGVAMHRSAFTRAFMLPRWNR